MRRRTTGPTFVARARVNRPKWEEFDARAELADTDRSKLINEFIDWYLRKPGARLPQRPELLEAERARDRHAS